MGLHCRGVGARPIAKKLVEAKYKERGTLLAEAQKAQMSTQLGMFKTNLEEFASKHKQEIQKEPEFPGQFLDTCVALAWISSPLEEDFGLRWGGAGAFCCDLGIQTMGMCVAPTPRKGGLLTLEGLQQDESKGRGRFAQDVIQDRSIRAMKKLEAPGTGAGAPAFSRHELSSALSAPRNHSWQGGSGYVTVGGYQSPSQAGGHALGHLPKEGPAGWPRGFLGRLATGCQLSWQTPPPRPLLLRPEKPCPDRGGVEGGTVAGREKTDELSVNKP